VLRDTLFIFVYIQVLFHFATFDTFFVNNNPIGKKVISNNMLCFSGVKNTGIVNIAAFHFLRANKIEIAAKLNE